MLLIGNAKPGATVELQVVHRNAKTSTIKAKLGELSDDQPAMTTKKKAKQQPQVRKFQWQSP